MVQREEKGPSCSNAGRASSWMEGMMESYPASRLFEVHGNDDMAFRVQADVSCKDGRVGRRRGELRDRAERQQVPFLQRDALRLERIPDPQDDVQRVLHEAA